MKVKVTDECIACNLCVETCPEVFELGDEETARVKVDTVPPELEDKVREAAEDCPTEAIVIEDK